MCFVLIICAISDFLTFFNSVPHVSLQQIKTDIVLLMCKKQTNKKWDCLTKVEKQAKEKKEWVQSTVLSLNPFCTN